MAARFGSLQFLPRAAKPPRCPRPVARLPTLSGWSLALGLTGAVSLALLARLVHRCALLSQAGARLMQSGAKAPSFIMGLRCLLASGTGAARSTLAALGLAVLAGSPPPSGAPPLPPACGAREWGPRAAAAARPAGGRRRAPRINFWFVRGKFWVGGLTGSGVSPSPDSPLFINHSLAVSHICKRTTDRFGSVPHFLGPV